MNVKVSSMNGNPTGTTYAYLSRDYVIHRFK